MGGDEPDLAFKIELWDDADRRIEEVIALAADFASACGAFDEAVKRRPSRRASNDPAQFSCLTNRSLKGSGSKLHYGRRCDV